MVSALTAGLSDTGLCSGACWLQDTQNRKDAIRNTNGERDIGNRFDVKDEGMSDEAMLPILKHQTAEIVETKKP